jgi:hypothetical protein
MPSGYQQKNWSMSNETCRINRMHTDDDRCGLGRCSPGTKNRGGAFIAIREEFFMHGEEKRHDPSG